MSESNALGGWVLIGYSGPGVSDAANSSHTTNFGYAGSITATSTGTAADNSPDWSATSSVPLNDCASGNAWKIVSTAGDGGTVTFAASNGDAACVALTPSYCKIATSGSCGS